MADKRDKLEGSSLKKERYDQNQGVEIPEHEDNEAWHGTLYTSATGGVDLRDQYSRNPITNTTHKIEHVNPFPFTRYPGLDLPTPKRVPSQARRSTMGMPPIYDENNIAGEED